MYLFLCLSPINLCHLFIHQISYIKHYNISLIYHPSIHHLLPINYLSIHHQSIYLSVCLSYIIFSQSIFFFIIFNLFKCGNGRRHLSQLDSLFYCILSSLQSTIHLQITVTDCREILWNIAIKCSRPNFHHTEQIQSCDFFLCSLFQDEYKESCEWF